MASLQEKMTGKRMSFALRMAALLASHSQWDKASFFIFTILDAKTGFLACPATVS